MDWEKIIDTGDWAQLIQNLSRVDDTLNEIFKIDGAHLIVQGEERAKLERLQAANKNILHKLQSREFTVAIVGLEKAGKSTLGNALIKSMVLPEYSERCTYTTTEIRAGDTDVAEVYFYSRDEFNGIFKRMLANVEYTGAEDFFNMTLEMFKRYWSGVENNPEQSKIFNDHNGTTAEDIKTMLEGKQKIIELLGHAPIKFGSEYWTGSDEFNEFKIYITGISGKNPDGSVIRQPHPYAVKNVIIHSTQLADMSNIVLYDVPGFDSPTELHKRQTEEMLKIADAIILVTNAGNNPNLTGTQLDMLRKGLDTDGIKLSAKAFVFGNKIDRASDATTAQNNLAALTNEAVNKYQIALPNHIVGGSARAYLEGAGLISGDVAKKVIDAWNFTDGIGSLHEKMQYYYDNDRFEVIKRRARNTLAAMQNILQEILKRYSNDDGSESAFREKTLMQIQSSLPKFLNAAKDISRNYISEISAERPFTTTIENNIQTIYPLIEENPRGKELITNTDESLGISVDGIVPITTIDGNVRDKLSKKFVENIAVAVSKLTLDKQKELLQKLIDAFLENMGMEISTPHRAELRESANVLFNKMLNQSGLAQGNFYCNFNVLVERFVTTLIQALIATPFARPERLQALETAMEEFATLALYYNVPVSADEKKNLRFDNLGSYGLNFIAQIVTHSESGQKKTAAPNFVSENRIFLTNFFEKYQNQICIGLSNFSINSFPIEKWANNLSRAGINFQTEVDKPKAGDFVYDLRKYFYDNQWSNLNAKNRTQIVENFMSAYIQKNQQAAPAKDTELENQPIVEQLYKLNERAKNLRDMKNKTDLIEILNADIEILRDITKNSVIKAIALERAFISVATKNVELIRENLQAGEGADNFQDWIRANVTKLMPSQFNPQEQEIRKNRILILHSIEVLLNRQ